MSWKQHVVLKWVGFIQDSSVLLSMRTESFISSYRTHATLGLKGIGLAAAAAATLTLSACVESQTPLMTDTKPLIGEQFEVHLYENFVDGKASAFHTSVYSWKDGQYVRSSGLARDIKRFVVQPLAANNYLIQSSDENEKHYYFWIGRKLVDGVYTIFTVNETDVDDATRNAVCDKDQPEGYCRIRTYEQLITLARATAAKPARDAALGVVLAK